MPSEPIPPASQPPTEVERTLDEMNVVNAGYVAELYEQFRRDPSSVEGEWRALFESGLTPGSSPPAPSAPAAEPAGNGAAASEPAAAAALPAGATPIKGPAARLAQNMAASLAVPTATSFRDIPVATLEERRRAL